MDHFTLSLTKKLSIYDEQYFLRSLNEINKKLPIFKFSIKDFYLNHESIETKYIPLQDEISKKLY